MKKKSTTHSNFFKSDCSTKICDEVNCTEVGEYEAPKSPNSNEKYTFCLHHIKSYNKRWNYFAGKSQKEIYDFQKNDFLEGKPTRPFSKGSMSKIKFQFRHFFDKHKMEFRKKRKVFENNGNYSLNEKIEISLNILELKPNVSKDKLKQRYNSLVKKYHPDVRNNIEDKEMKIKEINKAYKVLQKYVKN
tara:strand:+ start:170 stop:736 length:567 start_codon:yes stop_codon:yes gene_type:complete